jgi:hypothetical protein
MAAAAAWWAAWHRSESSGENRMAAGTWLSNEWRRKDAMKESGNEISGIAAAAAAAGAQLWR